MSPTSNDRKLLQAILTLTEDAQGRPPSVEEVTLALGYQSSSRGNVHRRLLQLRPTYVMWEAKVPRSLRLTPLGKSLCGLPLAQAEEEPVSAVILPLLANGITLLERLKQQGIPLQVPYPDSWQKALSKLGAAYILHGLTPLADTTSLVRQCLRPLATWPVRFPDTERYGDQSLLIDQTPTDFCRELAATTLGDAEEELCERLILPVRDKARRERQEAAYVNFRRFLIEHPVATMDDLLVLSFTAGFESVGAELHEMYEPVPMTCAIDGQVFCCGFCKWTLERHHERLRCGDERCRLLTGGFSHGTQSILWSPRLYRVRRPIRRYIVAPGIAELRAFTAFTQMGVSVELWPGFDLYDLRVVFPGGTTWAIDVKDYRFPHMLARRLTPIRSESPWEWTAAFYAVPDERVHDTPGYLALLEKLTPTTGRNFSICTIATLLGEAQHLLHPTRF